MSYTEMFIVNKNGTVEYKAEFKNAFRSAWHVWDKMAERYLGQEASYLMFIGNIQIVWDLWKSDAVPPDYRITMAATFDKVMVRRENFHRLISSWKAFAKRFGEGSLLEQAEILETLISDESVYAVCWNQTSVNAAPWLVHDTTISDDEDEQWRPYNIVKDTGHWFLFDELARNEVLEV